MTEVYSILPEPPTPYSILPEPPTPYSILPEPPTPCAILPEPSLQRVLSSREEHNLRVSKKDGISKPRQWIEDDVSKDDIIILDSKDEIFTSSYSYDINKVRNTLLDNKDGFTELGKLLPDSLITTDTWKNEFRWSGFLKEDEPKYRGDDDGVYVHVNLYLPGNFYSKKNRMNSTFRLNISLPNSEYNEFETRTHRVISRSMFVGGSEFRCESFRPREIQDGKKECETRYLFFSRVDYLVGYLSESISVTSEVAKLTYQIYTPERFGEEFLDFIEMARVRFAKIDSIDEIKHFDTNAIMCLLSKHNIASYSETLWLGSEYRREKFLVSSYTSDELATPSEVVTIYPSRHPPRTRIVPIIPVAPTVITPETTLETTVVEDEEYESKDVEVNPHDTDDDEVEYKSGYCSESSDTDELETKTTSEVKDKTEAENKEKEMKSKEKETKITSEVKDDEIKKEEKKEDETKEKEEKKEDETKEEEVKVESDETKRTGIRRCCCDCDEFFGSVSSITETKSSVIEVKTPPPSSSHTSYPASEVKISPESDYSEHIDPEVNIEDTDFTNRQRRNYLQELQELPVITVDFLGRETELVHLKFQYTLRELHTSEMISKEEKVTYKKGCVLSHNKTVTDRTTNLPVSDYRKILLNKCTDKFQYYLVKKRLWNKDTKIFDATIKLPHYNRHEDNPYMYPIITTSTNLLNTISNSTRLMFERKYQLTLPPQDFIRNSHEFTLPDVIRMNIGYYRYAGYMRGHASKESKMAKEEISDISEIMMNDSDYAERLIAFTNDSHDRGRIIFDGRSISSKLSLTWLFIYDDKGKTWITTKYLNRNNMGEFYHDVACEIKPNIYSDILHNEIVKSLPQAKKMRFTDFYGIKYSNVKGTEFMALFDPEFSNNIKITGTMILSDKVYADYNLHFNQPDVCGARDNYIFGMEVLDQKTHKKLSSSKFSGCVSGSNFEIITEKTCDYIGDNPYSEMVFRSAANHLNDIMEVYHQDDNPPFPIPDSSLDIKEMMKSFILFGTDMSCSVTIDRNGVDFREVIRPIITQYGQTGNKEEKDTSSPIITQYGQTGSKEGKDKSGSINSSYGSTDGRADINTFSGKDLSKPSQMSTDEDGKVISASRGVKKEVLDQSRIYYKLVSAVKYGHPGDECVAILRLPDGVDSKVDSKYVEKVKASDFDVLSIKRIVIDEKTNTVIFKESLNKEECIICKDAKAIVIAFDCQHKLCFSCSEKCLSDKRICPKCRQYVRMTFDIEPLIPTGDEKFDTVLQDSLDFAFPVIEKDSTLIYMRGKRVKAEIFDKSSKTCSAGLYAFKNLRDIIKHKYYLEHFTIPDEIRPEYMRKGYVPPPTSTPSSSLSPSSESKEEKRETILKEDLAKQVIEWTSKKDEVKDSVISDGGDSSVSTSPLKRPPSPSIFDTDVSSSLTDPFNASSSSSFDPFSTSSSLLTNLFSTNSSLTHPFQAIEETPPKKEKLPKKETPPTKEVLSTKEIPTKDPKIHKSTPDKTMKISIDITPFPDKEDEPMDEMDRLFKEYTK